ncbi:MAG: hypothetical protein ACRD3I_04055 [Terriglobales bacterium]
MFFAHTEAGSLTHLLRGYYDTLTGPKREPASYRAIAADMQSGLNARGLRRT